MACLEELTPGARVAGVLPDRVVTVVQVSWHGSEVITLTHRDDGGRVADHLLYRDDEVRLDIETPSSVWAFDGDGELLRLVSEPRRIRLAYLFDPVVAVHLSVLEASWSAACL